MALSEKQIATLINNYFIALTSSITPGTDNAGGLTVCKVELPIRAIPKMDNDDPRRAKLRTEQQLPKLM
jgi:hypothetical protein